MMPHFEQGMAAANSPLSLAPAASPAREPAGDTGPVKTTKCCNGCGVQWGSLHRPTPGPEPPDGKCDGGEKAGG